MNVIYIDYAVTLYVRQIPKKNSLAFVKRVLEIMLANTYQIKRYKRDEYGLSMRSGFRKRALSFFVQKKVIKFLP